MKLHITKKAARYCKGYLDRKRCLAATAARFQFPRIKTIDASGTTVIIGRKKYYITEYDEIIKAYDATLKKISPEFQPFTLELTRV